MAYTTINKSTAHFESKLYAGSSSNVTVSGLEFQPDWIWLKNRSATDNHVFVDAVRGSGSYGYKNLYSNLTDAEYTPSSGNASVASIASNSFVVGANGNTNGNGENFVSWNWKANGSGSSNTDGSITSTVSANTTAGFSIVKYTGTGSNATVGHGLGVAPKMIIVKKLSTSGTGWYVYHKNIGASNVIYLNSTSSSAGAAAVWNSTDPSTSFFSIGTNTGVNNNGDTHIAYCFADKIGFSKCGFYYGNGNADGTFAYTGFKPTWIMGKKVDGATNNWYLFDSTRDTFNLTTKKLRPDTNAAENDNSSKAIDILSNGFKIKNTDAEFNNSGDKYIYLAFGQSLVGSNNIPCTAR